MSSPAPKSPEMSEKSKKYDRQIRYYINVLTIETLFNLLTFTNFVQLGCGAKMVNHYWNKLRYV